MDRQELSQILLELLEEETGEKFPGLNDSTNLREGLNLDSLDMVSLVLHTEVRLDIQIDSSQLNDVVTVGDLLDLLQSKLSSGGERQAA
jgi:acyl carrier protein